MCEACARDLPWDSNLRPNPAPECDATFCAFRLAAPVQEHIHALKYRAQFRSVQRLGVLMAQRLARRSAPMPTLLLPVPLHPTRLRARGYNQSHELGRVLARTLTIALDAQAALRLRATDDQIGKSAAERRRNVKGAFAVTRSLAGLHIAVLDDVMTTGATLAELARACRAAGAATIEAWALAYAPLKHPGT